MAPFFKLQLPTATHPKSNPKQLSSHSPNENLVDHFYYEVGLFRFSLLSEKSSAILKNHPGILSSERLPVLALFPRFQPRLLGLRLLVTSCFHSLADCKERMMYIIHNERQFLLTSKRLTNLYFLWHPCSLLPLWKSPSHRDHLEDLSSPGYHSGFLEHLANWTDRRCGC